MTDVLVQLEGGDCILFHDMPCIHSVRILVSFAGSASLTTKADARQLFDQLVQSCAALGNGRSTPACHGNYQGTGSCQSDFLPDAIREINVMMAVEDPHATFDKTLVASFLRLPSANIIPIVPTSGRAKPSPALLRHVLYRYSDGRPEDAAPEALAAAQIGDNALRLFVGYRHDDCATIAGQVFHALAESRFAVFLDRFNGNPGQDFIGRIMSELFDKGCLLVLEGPTTNQSSWVQGEIATAFMHRLGVIKVNLGGSFDLLPAKASLDLRQGRPAVDHNTQLANNDIDQIVDFVRGQYLYLGADRRRWLASNLDYAVQQAGAIGLSDHGTHGGTRLLQNQSGDQYRTALTPRPPMPSISASRRREPVVPHRWSLDRSCTRSLNLQPTLIGSLVSVGFAL